MAPLPLFALGALCGDTMWPLLQVEVGPALVAASALLLLGLIRARPSVRLFALTAAGWCAGLAMPAHLGPPFADVGEGQVRGVVVTSARGSEADVLVTAWEPEGLARRSAGGRVRVWFPDHAPAAGTSVVVQGDVRHVDLTHLPGEPDPAWDLARSAVIRRMRARTVVIVGADDPPRRELGSRYPGLVRALSTGDASGIPEPERLLLRRTGTWHLVSISGLHIGLAALLGWGLGWIVTRPLVLAVRMPGTRWVSALGAIGMACLYADLADWPLPAVRAVWVTVVGACCAAVGRTPGGWEALSLALVVTLAGEPGAVASPSFQLSFSAMAGMFLCADRVTRWIPPDTSRPLRWLGEALGASLGATAGTLPFVAWYFQSVSPLSLVANLWAVPWIGSVATPLVLLGNYAPASMAPLITAFADAAIDIGYFGMRAVDVEPLHPSVGPLGAVLLGLAVVSRRHLGMVGLFLVLALGLKVSVADGLRVSFLAIGQGDSTLVEWPGGAVWLVDGGPASDDVLHLLRRRGIHHIDRVILSHPHPDHYGGLISVFAGLSIGEVWVPRLARPDEQAYAELLVGQDVKVVGEAPGPMQVLHPLAGWRSPARDPTNDESLVVRFGYGAHTFLFPGDVERAGEARVRSALRHTTVLKVPHHGSHTSSSQAFVDAISPTIAVISCGYENRYAHPRPIALASYRGVQVLRTDLDGTIVITTDGTRLDIDTLAPPTTWLMDGDAR